MKTRLVNLAFLVISILISQQSFAASSDPNDEILLFYPLSEAEQTSFSTDDGIVSSFWTTNWIDRDYIDMTTALNSNPNSAPWSGSDDARITIKAAASPEGLFFYCKVTDDIWVDPVSGTGAWKYDAVDLFFDNKTSEEILAGGSSIMVNPAWKWALTFTSQQYQVWMGSAALPTTFAFNYYDNLFFTWSQNTVSFDQASLHYDGMKMEIIIEDNTNKVQEWFIPWSWVGTGGISGPINQGKRFAFTGGYNDMDGDGSSVGEIRWKNIDPFGGGNSLEEHAASWGDLEAAEDLQTGIYAPLQRSTRLKSASVGTKEFFNLKGERIRRRSHNDGYESRFTGITIERSTLQDGNSLIQKRCF